MTQTWLVYVAVGPLSSFITGGRRSRDLWFGSRLMSELTFRVAEQLQADGGELVVPSRDRLEDLQQKYADQYREVTGAGAPAARRDDLWTIYQGPTITNKVFAKLQAGDEREVQERLDRAEAAARTFLADELAALTRPEGKSRLKGLLDRELVEAQQRAIRQGDFVEVYAVWTALGPDAAESEHGARVEVARLMALRKSARVFPEPSWTREGHFKSSLDRGWDAVTVELPPAGRRGEAVVAREKARLRRARAGVRDDERLSAIDALRRDAVFRVVPTGEEGEDTSHALPPLQFPPLARVTADPWLEGVARSARGQVLLNQVRGHLRRMDGDALALLSSPCREPGVTWRERREPARRLFEYDPSLFFENGAETASADITRRRHPRRGGPPDAWADASAVVDALEGALTTLGALEKPLSEIGARFEAPLPYYALIEADGDGMGDLLAQAKGGEWRDLIERLYTFSDRAWRAIDGELHGAAFYVGGDELAFYCPLDKALPAIQELGRVFGETAGGRSVDGRTPSLSFGMVVAHLRDDLRITRRAARTALQAAKDRRKAAGPGEAGYLCVYEEPRAGSRRVSVGRAGELCDRLGALIDAHEHQLLSLRTSADLEELCERFEGLGPTVGLDLARALPRQKAVRSGLEELQTHVESAALRMVSWDDARRLAAEIRLAERLRRSAKQRNPELPGGQP